MPDNLAFCCQLSVLWRTFGKYCRFGPLSVIAANRLPGVFGIYCWGHVAEW